MTIGDLPEPLQEVSVYGYPIGGKTLSITKGMFSRVEQQVYAHAGTYLLPVKLTQLLTGQQWWTSHRRPANRRGSDAANAGGRAENLGYFVPPDM